MLTKLTSYHRTACQAIYFIISIIFFTQLALCIVRVTLVVEDCEQVIFHFLLLHIKLLKAKCIVFPVLITTYYS